MSSSPPRYPPSLPNPPSPPPLKPNPFISPPPPFPIPFPPIPLRLPESPQYPPIPPCYTGRRGYISCAAMSDESRSSGKWQHEIVALADAWISNPDYKKFTMEEYKEWTKEAIESPKWKPFMEAYLEWKRTTGASFYTVPDDKSSSSTSYSDGRP